MATLQRAPTPPSVDYQKIESSQQIPLGRGNSISPLQRMVFHQNLKVAYWLSSTLTVAATFVSAVAVFHLSLYQRHPDQETRGCGDTSLLYPWSPGDHIVLSTSCEPAEVTVSSPVPLPVGWLGSPQP
jgi:hypothetical protein